jgi:hypothetical protein
VRQHSVNLIARAVVKLGLPVSGKGSQMGIYVGSLFVEDESLDITHKLFSADRAPGWAAQGAPGL